MRAEPKTDYWARDPESCPALVLLIDDQALVAAALQRAIAGVPGIDVHYCGNPIEALAVAAELKPTVILLDLVMPQVDGLTLLRKFRANPATAHTPIVILSTKEDAEVKSDLFSAGANDYMVKLPDRLELVARIKYHSMSAWNRIQRDEAFDALRRSQQALVASNTALIAANEQLARTTQARNDFLASLTLEMGAPLQAVAQRANRLLQPGAAADANGALLDIRQSAEALGRLVGDVSDFSKMEAGKVSLEAVDFDLAGLFDELLGATERAAAAKRLYLAAMIPPHTPTRLRGDPHRLRQVLANLVVNGLEYTTRGGVCLRVSQLSETGLQTILCFEVLDSGSGIPPEAQTLVFQPFARRGEASAQPGHGAGLGLAICRQLVELMGGHIGLESTPGKGTIFRFTIPFEKQRGTPPAPEEEPLHHHILVVDGDEWVRRLIEQQLSYCGCHVNGASGAEEALRMLREPGGVPYELVLLHVPEEDASPLASKLRSEPAAASAALALLAPEASVDGVPWGVDAVVPWPLRPPSVSRRIGEILSKKKPA